MRRSTILRAQFFSAMLAMGCAACASEVRVPDDGGDGGASPWLPGGPEPVDPPDDTFDCSYTECIPLAELVDCDCEDQAGAGGGGGGDACAAQACPDVSNDLVCAADGSWQEYYVDYFVGAEGDSCCYEVTPPCGRPFLVSGEARRAPVVVNEDWAPAKAPTDDELDPATRRALARAWQNDAEMEHASVAAFARFTMQLLALGAPPELLRASQRAGLEETRHAEDCFALASRFAGGPLGPGPLALEGVDADADLTEVAVLAVHEGCVGETVAAMLASAQLEEAADPQIRETLERIVEDEARHAELAWQFVAWAIDRGGEPTRAAVRAAFRVALASEPSTQPGVDDPAYHRFGRLGAAEQRDVFRAALREVVAPCARVLLGEAFDGEDGRRREAPTPRASV